MIMKIDTVNDGLIEVPKVIKYFIHNGRKIAIHQSYFSGEGFTNKYYSATDYQTGMRVAFDYSVKQTIIRAKNTLDNNSDYDYSKHKIINV